MQKLGIQSINLLKLPVHRVWTCWQHERDTVWPHAVQNYSPLHYSLCLLHLLPQQPEQSTQTAPVSLLWESGKDTRNWWLFQESCWVLSLLSTYLSSENKNNTWALQWEQSLFNPASYSRAHASKYSSCKLLYKIPVAPLRYSYSWQNDGTCKCKEFSPCSYTTVAASTVICRLVLN